MAIKKDLDLIVLKLPKEQDLVRIYPLGDLHYGAEEYNDKAFQRWKKCVMEDDKAVVVLVGDLINNATKSSVSNSYKDTCSPSYQKAWLKEQLMPIRDKIIGAVTGNHEHRSSVAVDDCPLYDVLCKLDLEDLYRENMTFIKMVLGEKNKVRQWTYTMVLAHGGSKASTEKFSYSIDGMDLFITGHLHQGISEFPSKIVIDSKNNVVTEREFMSVRVPSFTSVGGYSLKQMYLPKSGVKFPVIELSGERKETSILWK